MTNYTDYRELGRVRSISWGEKMHPTEGQHYYVRLDSNITVSGEPIEATFGKDFSARAVYNAHVLLRYRNTPYGSIDLN